jgi:hypothetical protein
MCVKMKSLNSKNDFQILKNINHFWKIEKLFCQIKNVFGLIIMFDYSNIKKYFTLKQTEQHRNSLIKNYHLKQK